MLPTKLRRAAGAVCILLSALLMAGCSSTRHVPEGEYLLDKVTISVADSAVVSAKPLYNYLRQSPNHKVLGAFRMQLGVYNMAGADSTSRFNRWLKSIGEAPVIYDQQLTDQSVRQLRQALVNSGYTVSSYGNDVVYLNDVPQLNYYWPDAALYYNNGRLYGSQFTYSSPYYDMNRYNTLYNTLMMQYGAPVQVVNNGPVCSATWYGAGNRYVTLSFNSGYSGQFYTTLSFGN